MCNVLDNWLTENCADYGALKKFAEAITVTTVSLDRYRKGERIPNETVMPLIYLHTGGEVQPNHFYALPDISKASKRRKTAA